jgi:threonine dehydratase
MLIPKQDIETAAARIRAHLAVTPLVRADHFSRKLGANVFFKLETLQPTHSFKVRGANVALENVRYRAAGVRQDGRRFRLFICNN